MHRNLFKSIFIILILFILTTTSAQAIQVKPLKEIIISEEESKANLTYGTQATLEAERFRENEKKHLEAEYEKIGKVLNEEELEVEELEVDESHVNEERGYNDIIVADKKKNLSKEKNAELRLWEKKGGLAIGQYTRKINQINGEMPNDAKRLKLNEVKNLISNNDFKAAVDKIEKMNHYPDFEGGSGITIKEFWLDENGFQKILVLVEQEQIFYVTMQDEQNLGHVELLN